MTINKHLAALAAFAIGAIVFSSAASAHCARHAYNNSSRTAHVWIVGSTYPNEVNHDIPPGGSIAFQHVDGPQKKIILRLLHPTGQRELDLKVTYTVQDCFIETTKESGPTWSVIINKPADGDVEFRD